MNDTYRRLLGLLKRLREAKIAFSLRQSREDAVMVEVNVPGQRWEIEFVDYDDEIQVEIERFVSNGHIDDESALEELFATFGEKDGEPEQTPELRPATQEELDELTLSRQPGNHP